MLIFSRSAKRLRNMISQENQKYGGVLEEHSEKDFLTMQRFKNTRIGE